MLNNFLIHGEYTSFEVVGVSDRIEIPWQTRQPPGLLWPYSCGKCSNSIQAFKTVFKITNNLSEGMVVKLSLRSEEQFC